MSAEPIIPLSYIKKLEAALQYILAGPRDDSEGSAMWKCQQAAMNALNQSPTSENAPETRKNNPL